MSAMMIRAMTSSSCSPRTRARPRFRSRRAASGGELARAMLALRLVLSAAPPILIFDEVDAGIGGQAALMVGRALAALGTDHQVLVVTHLPQVAAFADAQVAVTKMMRAGATVARAETLGPTNESWSCHACCQELRRAHGLASTRANCSTRPP